MSTWARVMLAAVAGIAVIVIAAVVVAPGSEPGVLTALSESSHPPPSSSSSSSSATGPAAGGRTMAPTAGPRLPNQPTNAGDATHPGDGVWIVGPTAANHVITTGTYETTVPAGSPGCTWSRVALNHTITATGRATRGQPVRVTLVPGDALFNTKGCGEWHVAAHPLLS